MFEIVGSMVNYVLLHPAAFAGVVAAVTVAVTAAVTATVRYVTPTEPDRLRADRLESALIDAQARLSSVEFDYRSCRERLDAVVMLIGSEREDFDRLSAEYDKLCGALATVENRERGLIDAYNELAATLQASEVTASADRDATLAEMNRRDEDHEDEVGALRNELVELAHLLRVRDDRIEAMMHTNDFLESGAQAFAERVDELESQVKQLRAAVLDRCEEVDRLLNERKVQERHIEESERAHAETVSSYENARKIAHAVMLGKDHPDAAGVPKFEEGEDVVYVASGRQDKAGRPFWFNGGWCYASKNGAKEGLTSFIAEGDLRRPETGAFGLPTGGTISVHGVPSPVNIDWSMPSWTVSDSVTRFSPSVAGVSA